MKQRVLPITLVILGTLALTAMLAQAQTISNGPYYATPSWDQKLQCDTLATCPRFVVLSNWNNEAVLDRETGLVWEQNPDVSVPESWTGANHRITLSGCLGRVTGGRVGWRLPRIEELASLTIPGLLAFSQVLPTGHPFGSNASGTFWSATTSVFDSSFAEVSTIGPTGGFGGRTKTELHQVWCVRSPSPGFVGQ